MICWRDNLGLTFAEASCFCSLTKQSRKKREKKKKLVCVSRMIFTHEASLYFQVFKVSSGYSFQLIVD